MDQRRDNRGGGRDGRGERWGGRGGREDRGGPGGQDGAGRSRGGLDCHFERRTGRSTDSSFHSRGRAGRSSGGKRIGNQPLPGCDSSGWAERWVQLKYYRFAPAIFSGMIGAASAAAQAGDAVQVRDPDGGVFGWGFWNPRARVPLRIVSFGAAEVDLEVLLEERLRAAVRLRRALPGVLDSGNAWRAVNSDGDEVSGLVADVYGSVLAVEVHSLALWRRLPRLLEVLHEELGTTGQRVSMDPALAEIEGVGQRERAEMEAGAPEKVKVVEHGLRYEVDFGRGHKTGFFCDQRDNRARLGRWLAALTPGARVLDLCSYAGGFSLAAAAIGGAAEVIGVDLDEDAVAMARRNANLNDLAGRRVRFIHADAFGWARQAVENGERFDCVVVDPPKFVASRALQEEGERKYQDLNSLAVRLVKPGGLFVSCSCSGLVDTLKFRELVSRGVHRAGRSLRFLAETGAGPDHPVASRAQEGRYLKVLWAVVGSNADRVLGEGGWEGGGVR